MTSIQKTGLSCILYTVLTILAAVAFLSCNRSKSLVKETHQVRVDSFALRHLQSRVDSLQSENSRVRSEKEIIREELETVLSGSTGDPVSDTIFPEVPFQKRRLTAGADYIDVSGRWLYLDYKWYRASRVSISKEVKDSITSREKSYRALISQKDRALISLQSELQLEKEKVKRGLSWFQQIVAALFLLAGGIAVGKFIL